MSWFEELTGFREATPQQVREKIVLDGEQLSSKVNGRVMTCGRLETPTLRELRERVGSGSRNAGKLSVREVIAYAQELHADASLAGALFQVASQFNLLEMVSPNITPEHGVAIYENDHTQGPACAVAAGAGTIYRNYFAPVNGRIGQSKESQIDCLADIGQALGNSKNRMWAMRNGYALPSYEGLKRVSNQLGVANEKERDGLRELLRIGLQWNTQVTLDGSRHLVSQAYCSALPIAYCDHHLDLWENFASLILEATYEAALCAAILNSLDNGSPKVFLTLVGGGAFGNPVDWILAALERALNLYENFNLDVAIVSYGRSNHRVRELVQEFAH